MSNKIVMMNIRRHFSLFRFPLLKNFVNHEVKFMNKLIGNANKKRKFYIDDKIPSTQYKVTEAPKGNKENSRRIAVLNKLFMKSISEILTAGSISHDIFGKGLEISRVSVNPNFNQVNVFWACRKEENMAELEKVLPDLGFTLRHQLSQLKAMGVVPRIVFVKDKHHYSVLKVEHLLTIADYGEDHEQPVSEFKEDTFLYDVSPNPENNGKGAQEEKTAPEGETNINEEPIPEMTHDIFRLDHNMIMEKIMKRMNKAKAMHRYHPNLEIECEGMSYDLNSTESPVDILSVEERKEAIANFLLQRKIQKRKIEATLNTKDNEELKQNDVKYDDDDDVDDFYTEDYIDDDYYEEDKRQL